MGITDGKDTEYEKDIAEKLMEAFNNVCSSEGEKRVNTYLLYRAINYIEKMEIVIKLIRESPAGKIVLDELRRTGKIKC